MSLRVDRMYNDFFRKVERLSIKLYRDNKFYGKLRCCILRTRNVNLILYCEFGFVNNEIFEKIIFLHFALFAFLEEFSLLLHFTTH